MRRNALQNC